MAIKSVRRHEGIGSLLGVLLLTGIVGLPSSAQAVIVLPALGLSVSGIAVNAGDEWEYRYTITDLGGGLPLGADDVRFIISEDETHAGLHHEDNILADAGVFSYDFAVPPAFAGIKSHNYFWDLLDMPGVGGGIIVGFNDVHGPTLETWGIQAINRGFSVQAGPLNLLPVPCRLSRAVGDVTADQACACEDTGCPLPEPTSVLLLITGLFSLLCYGWMRKELVS